MLICSSIIIISFLFYLQGGDSIPADSIVVSNTTIASSESALTGEPEDLKKSKNKDCFLLSSCLITEGEGCRALVIGIGPHSQWGKIKANLVTESVNTPLQDKLQHMTTNVSTDMCTYVLGSFYHVFLHHLYFTFGLCCYAILVCISQIISFSNLLYLIS